MSKPNMTKEDWDAAFARSDVDLSLCLNCGEPVFTLGDGSSYDCKDCEEDRAERARAAYKRESAGEGDR